MDIQDFKEEWRNREGHICCHTSGSTGIPKTISLPKEKVKESALRTIGFFRLTSESRLHLCISPDYIGGKMMIVRSEVLGCKLTSEKPSNRPLSDCSDLTPIDLLAVVPSQLRYILNNKDSLPDIKNILSGGGPIDSSLRDEIADSGFRVFESYGMTETSSHIAIRQVTKELSHFTTLGDISVSTDESCCLVIDMPGWQKIKTNDIAEVFNKNEFIILGRKDNVIISGGKKFFPEEIEEMLSPYIEKPFAITSVADPKWGEKMVCVVDNNIYDAERLEKTGSFIAGKFPHDKIPKEYFAIDKIPMTETGKIKRKELRDLVADSFGK